MSLSLALIWGKVPIRAWVLIRGNEVNPCHLSESANKENVKNKLDVFSSELVVVRGSVSTRD